MRTSPSKPGPTAIRASAGPSCTCCCSCSGASAAGSRPPISEPATSPALLPGDFMNAIAQMESPLAASTAVRVEQLLPQSPAARSDILTGGFPDPGAAQRQADRAAAARLTYEARLARERRERVRFMHVAALAREEGRVEGAAQAATQRHASFWSGWRWGFACGFPFSGLFFIAVISAGVH